MKFVIMLCLFSVTVFASVTPAQMKEIRLAATDVMYAVGGEGELNATVTKVKVVSELGSRVKVQFTYEEQMYGERTCTFYYDLKVMDVVNSSWLCGN